MSDSELHQEQPPLNRLHSDSNMSVEELEQRNRDFFSMLANKGLEAMKQSDSLELAVSNLYKALTAHTSKISYRKPAERARFRGSDTPFCEMKFLLDNLREKPRFEEVRYMSEFYTTGGDAFHENLQKWLGFTGFAYGKFKCKKCGTLYPKKSKEDDNIAMFGPVVCCDEPANYFELQPKNKYFSGHVDLILNVHGKLLVTELKQMGENVYDRRLKNGYDNHHYHQVQIYRKVLGDWLPEGMELHPWVLLWYFDRGDCKINKQWMLKYDPNVYEKEVIKFKKASKILESYQPKVHTEKNKLDVKCKMLCRKVSDNPYCPYGPMLCFAPDDQRSNILKSLLPNVSFKQQEWS